MSEKSRILELVNKVAIFSYQLGKCDGSGREDRENEAAQSLHEARTDLAEAINALESA